MKRLLAMFAIVLLATTAWADLGLPNELLDPGFETGGTWTTSGGVSNHLPYSLLAPFGVPVAPGGGAFAGGVAGQNISFGGGELLQIVDESQFPGWIDGGIGKTVDLTFYYFAAGYADVPFMTNVYLGYMLDGSFPDPVSGLYVKQNIATYTGASNGWQSKNIRLDLPVQPRYLSVHFEFSYFSGTGAILVDNANLQGQCVVPEPVSVLAMASGIIGLAGFAIRRRR